MIGVGMIGVGSDRCEDCDRCCDRCSVIGV
jgi:hypothetical protein